MSDDGLFREIEEDVRRERMQQFAKRYGTLIAAAAGAIILGAAAFVFWQDRVQTSIHQTSAQYAALTSALQAQGPAEQEADALAAFAAAELEGNLATIARLREAVARLNLDDRETAIAIYDGIAADDSVDPVLGDLATLLSVMHQIQEADAQQLDSRLAPLTAPANAWRHTARELRGAIALEAGDDTAAAEHFQAILADPATPEPLRERASRLVEFLGAAVPAETL